MKIKAYLLLTIILFSACDILRFSQFEVVAWSPGAGYYSEPEKITVSLSFSHEPNKASVERGFSLAADGNSVRGTFLWAGKKVIFSPLTPLEPNTDYTINLSADAKNNDGLSMDEAFFCFFTTRLDNTRPVVTWCYPSMYEEIDDLKAQIKLRFSKQISVKSLYENVSFSPSVKGHWQLDEGDKLVIFTPEEPWKQNTRYEIRFSSSLTDKNGMNVRNDFLSVFSTGIDNEIPVLLNVKRVTKTGEYIELIANKNKTENDGWEKEDKILLEFSKPVDSLTIKNYISIEDGPGFIIETIPGFNTEIILKFDRIPIYESRFTIKIRPGIKDISGNETKEDYVYRIFANGKLSMPPLLTGLRFPVASIDDTDNGLVFYRVDSLFEIIPISDEYFPSGESIKTWIELYFKTAEGASVDLFSLMELFNIETSNNVLNFSPRQIKVTDLTVSEPHAGYENYQRVEIAGNIINSTNFGIVIFQIAAGLKDSFGNKNDKLQKISLIK